MKKEPLIVSSDTIDAIAEGKSIDREFDKRIKREFKNDIIIRKSVDKFVWNHEKFVK